MRTYSLTIEVEAPEPLSSDVPVLSALVTPFASQVAANLPTHMTLTGAQVTSYEFDEDEAEQPVSLPSAVRTEVAFDPEVNQ